MLALSLVVVGVYELYATRKRRAQPLRFARTAHAHIRANWARAVRAKAGNEVLVVQTLRNSVMAASISASTAVLAFVALVTQLARPGERVAAADVVALDLHGVLIILLMVMLFGAFVLSAMAVRFFNHAGYILATPLSHAAGEALTEVGARYVARAGHLYSLSLRSFLVAAPFVVGLASASVMPIAAVALVAVLVWYDQPPPIHAPEQAERQDGPVVR
jgi:hypothetical protein